MTVRLLTVDEAASELRVHPETVRRLIRRGDLCAFKAGRAWRVPADSLIPAAPRAPRAPRPRPVTGEARQQARRILAARAGEHTNA